MKKIGLILLVVVLASFKSMTKSTDTEIQWVTIEEAIELQKTAPKKIIMDVYTNWCGPCKLLDKNTFHNADVVDYINKHYYAVKFNGEGDDKVTYKENTYTNPNYDPTKANRRESQEEVQEKPETHQEDCKNFLNGYCNKKSMCTFSHRGREAKCKFHYRGQCKKGSQCIYSHKHFDNICRFGRRCNKPQCRYSHTNI